MGEFRKLTETGSHSWERKLHVGVVAGGSSRLAVEMQVRALVLALAVFLAVLPGSVGKDAERELYPDPRKHPASCGRQGLTTSLVCDPSSILAQDESDRVDVVARHLHPVPWSPGPLP